MKERRPVLYPTDEVAVKVTEYSEQHSLELPKWIEDYHSHIYHTQAASHYMISTFQAKYSIWLARLIGAKNILEIGVYVGFSSLVWSHAVGPSGSVTGLEFSPEYAALAEEALKSRGVSNVKIIVGDALEQLPLLEPTEPYDLIFVDAQKTGYPEYLATILERSRPGAVGGKRLLRKGGLIVADNTLRRGLVADDSEANPHRASMNPREFDEGGNLEKVREFNDLVRRDARLEAVVLPLWDGLVLARLVD